MKQDLNLLWSDQIVFSDYTQNDFGYYAAGIRFTKKMMFLCHNYGNMRDDLEFDDWPDWETIEICPWENIIKIDRYDGLNVIRSVSQKDINTWLEALDDVQLVFPVLKIANENLAIMMEGRPYSEKSKNSLNRQKRILENTIPMIKSIVNKPFTFQTSLYIDVFTTQRNTLPDIDRFIQPIMDFFKGILYEDDCQVDSLHPRIFNFDEPFPILECRADPMGLSSVENIPVGSLFPLARNVRDYYVIRFRVH